MNRQNIFKYNYTFLYQSIAVYATTLAAYLLIRGLTRPDFSEVLHDPVVYLLCLIIIVSAVAVLYNVLMRRRIEITGTALIIQSAFRRSEIERKNIKSIRIGIERTRGIISSARVITIFLKERRRPIRLRPYNFERNDELFTAISDWAGDLLQRRKRRRQ